MAERKKNVSRHEDEEGLISPYTGQRPYIRTPRYVLMLSRRYTKIEKISYPVKLYSLVGRFVHELYKQLDIILQVLKISQFLYLNLPLKSNKE